MNKYQTLIAAFSNSTQGPWAADQVTGIIRENEANVTFICQAQNLMPDILADLQRLKQIDEALQSKGMDSELEANLKDLKSALNKGSAFISEDEAIANPLPALLEDVERLQWLEAELHRVRDRAGKLESTLHSAVNVLQSMRCQIEQMRGMFDDEDSAIQSACDEHDNVEQLVAQVTAE